MKPLFNLRLLLTTMTKSLALSAILFACTDSNDVTPSATPVDEIASSESMTGKQGYPGAREGWGPETPNFNLQAILRGENGGFGLVKFRQPNDDKLVVYLDVWVRNLEPNTSYELQRAVDTNLDGNCTSTSWLTLGKGLEPQTIDTDDKGTGTAQLWRSVAAFPVGSTFDIHFRVVKVSTMAEVLSSDCYQFTISQ